ncbi:SDR family oxidoreductase [Flavobacteriaceae bacterium 14752]|uniref:SDR family oxidoreductase n=1 Tax=Mesohalobacter salilacus TaxID=2491711 RepID=UPI000F6316CC|nr:SDR family oxidoreductase [Flavobacteriaceae bacterium 14752]
MEYILIIGANGKTGRIISKVLNNASGYKPYAMIREEKQKSYFENQGIETRIGDLEDNFSKAFENIDKVIFAAGSGGQTGDDKTTAIDQDGAIKAIVIAENHSLQKFVILSSMGTDKPEQVKGLEHYLKAKKTADDFLRASNIPFTIIQPGALTDEDGREKVEIAKHLNKPGKISREDVAQALVYALELDIIKNRSFEMISGEDDLKSAMESYS